MVPTLVLGLVAAAVFRRFEPKPSEPVATA
jgi:hypothetical protein